MFLQATQIGSTQYGRHRDDWGNWFGCNNSVWCWHYFLPEQYLVRNPFLVLKNTRAKTRLQALCTLDGLGAITPEILLTALRDKDFHVRENAVRLSEPFLRNAPESISSARPGQKVGEALLKLMDDPEIRVRYQLAFTLGEWNDPRASAALTRLAMREPGFRDSGGARNAGALDGARGKPSFDKSGSQSRLQMKRSKSHKEKSPSASSASIMTNAHNTPSATASQNGSFMKST